MPVFTLDNELSFPPVHLAEPDGLLAIGGDLSTTRLLTAYRNGIFPWYEDEVPLWWCPDPRFVLFPDKLKINKTTKALLKRNEFEFSINTAFKEVIHHCKNVIRPGQEGTWITPEVEKAYCKLYELGHAHSAEVWKNNKLVGGLYGIKMGKVFGESMFSIRKQCLPFCIYKIRSSINC
jgi:leucyl/phenylalanyl-tRNA--protein transferase